MIKTYFKQAIELMRQNRLFSTLYIVGTLHSWYGAVYRHDGDCSGCLLCKIGTYISGG